MNTTTVTTPSELEIRVERIFDAPRAHVFSVWTDPTLIPEWWGDGTVVEEMDVRPGGTYRFQTAYGVVEGEFREVDAPERLVQTFQNHLQTLEFEDLGGPCSTASRKELRAASRAWMRCCSGYCSTRELAVVVGRLHDELGVAAGDRDVCRASSASTTSRWGPAKSPSSTRDCRTGSVRRTAIRSRS